jgi:hypothetical protein
MLARQEPMWDLLHEAASAGPVATAVATSYLTSTDADTKATAIDLLGVVGEFHADQRDAIVATLAGIEPAVRCGNEAGVARALGRTGSDSAIDLLIGFADHHDAGVRREAANALSQAMWADYTEDGVRALIGLTRDADPEVRNRATFALGWQLAVDGVDVREALWERTEDEYDEARAEGIRGLARRRDQRVVPLVAELLLEGEAHLFTFDAAAFLAAPELVPLLAAYDIIEFGVAEALQECDPAARLRRDNLAWKIFNEVHARRPDLPISLYCERFEVGIHLGVAPIGEPATIWWPVESLLERAGDDPIWAAELACADVDLALVD